jgi:hypothetical protein
MKKRSLVTVVFACAGLGCSDPVSVVPTSPSLPAVTVFEITGPASIAPGQSVQLTVVGRTADGVRKALGPNETLAWFTSNPSVLDVTSTGLATATEVKGEARITARISGGTRGASREFVVVPEGTYRVVGTVRDSQWPTQVLPGARVEVAPGPLAATTNADGHYRLYGVPANAAIVVTRPGYSPLTVPLDVTSHITRDFELAVDGERLTLSGEYTVVIDSSGGCSSGNLPEQLRLRVYQATVTQNGPRVEVVLTEPVFRRSSDGRGDRFTGFADAHGVAFTLDPLGPYYYYNAKDHPSVAERLPDGTVLVPQGQSIVSGSAGRASGGFDAVLTTFGSRFPYAPPLAHCAYAGAQLTLTRR